MRSAALLAGLLLALCACAFVPSTAARPLTATTRQAVAPVPFIPQRIVFDPNRGENNKIEDYIANVYIGEVDIATAAPVAAGTGAAAAAGVQLTYDKSSYFDYENPKSRLDAGPGAKAIGAAVARVLGTGTAKAAAKGYGKANLSYKRDAYNENAIALGTVNELGAGLSAGLYLDRTAGNDNTPLLQTPRVNFAFGR